MPNQMLINWGAPVVTGLITALITYVSVTTKLGMEIEYLKENQVKSEGDAKVLAADLMRLRNAVVSSHPGMNPGWLSAVEKVESMDSETKFQLASIIPVIQFNRENEIEPLVNVADRDLLKRVDLRQDELRAIFDFSQIAEIQNEDDSDHRYTSILDSFTEHYREAQPAVLKIESD